MLTVYFDDSGTHDTSKIVLVGGLIGNQYQWEAFNKAWAEKLQNSSPGKGPLRRFHMYDCQAGDGEFLGWSRTETDFLVHQLGAIVLKNNLGCYGCAISRKDWDDLVVGETRDALGDAEGFCMRNCYVASRRWCEAAWHAELAFVFDNRPHKYLENSRVFDVFKGNAEDHNKTPKFASLTFAPSLQTLPLQGADLVAWEMYQQIQAVLRGDVGPRDDFYRKQLARLVREGNVHLQYAFRDEIARIANRDRGARAISLMATYFKTGQYPDASAAAESC